MAHSYPAADNNGSLEKRITELLEDVNRGDKKDFTLLIHKLHEEFSTKLKLAAHKRSPENRTYNHEDLTYDCFSLLIKRLQDHTKRSFNNSGEVFFWLLKALHLRFLDNQRRLRRAVTFDPQSTADPPYDDSIQIGIRDLIQTAFSRLQPEHVPLLRDWAIEEMTHTELMHKYNCTSYHVSKLIKTFCEILRSLEKRDV